MKKLCTAMVLLCLIVSVSSCTADDLDETVKLNEIPTQEILFPEFDLLSVDNGDVDKDKRGDDKND
ncbi:MAG TPA: hypothetical protein VNJ50_11240 [Gelidibacter sp.]|uniref:hypothetical protein n=1 Tax=Gelidibacter sp. TaxID=2018083 RepID=UPI002BA74065|nr:hypothetical protein [Gelidibacter sp.]HTO16441.1 hypothetical protein [Edaphocola sp.]HXJ99415.1 hypothetical protein [Gelidibacter sp.]